LSLASKKKKIYTKRNKTGVSKAMETAKAQTAPNKSPKPNQSPVLSDTASPSFCVGPRGCGLAKVHARMHAGERISLTGEKKTTFV